MHESQRREEREKKKESPEISTSILYNRKKNKRKRNKLSACIRGEEEGAVLSCVKEYEMIYLHNQKRINYKSSSFSSLQ